MKYSTNYHMNKPELSEQYRLDHWNDNTNIIDTELKRNADNIATAETALQNAINEESSRATTAETALQNITDSTFKTALLNFCYPVGSLYWSSKSDNPSTLFGGTWTRIKDRFVLAAGDTYGNGTTGGSATVALNATNLPAHSHTCEIVNTDHNHYYSINTTTSSDTWEPMAWNGEGVTIGGRFENGSSLVDRTSSNFHPIKHTHAHTIKFSEYTGTVAGNMNAQSHSHTVNGGGNGTASGNAHENMPPYLVKFCWERVS